MLGRHRPARAPDRGPTSQSSRAWSRPTPEKGGDRAAGQRQQWSGHRPEEDGGEDEQPRRIEGRVDRRVVGVRGTSLASLVGAGGGLVALVALGVRPVMGWDGFVQAGGVLGVIAAATAVFAAAASMLAFDQADVSRETTTSAVGVPGSSLTAN